jgi:hypothetical protein
MKTNDLKRGSRVKLLNGWEAEIADNMKGNTRLATVYGEFTETGSVYAHDIVQVQMTSLMSRLLTSGFLSSILLSRSSSRNSSSVLGFR